jgi:TolB-like protein
MNLSPFSSSATWFTLLLFAILFSPQQAFSQGPAVNSLSSSLAEIASRSGRKTVAVVDFTDLQGCVTELGRYMAEDVSVALVNNAKGFEVIDRTNLKVLMQEHKLASTGIIDPATARQLGQIAGVDALVTGTIAPLGDSVHVSAKVLDTETAKVLGGITADIPKTRTVEELLAKNVANCSSAPPSQGSASGLQAASNTPQASQKPRVVRTGEIGDFVITIAACQRTGERVQCSGSVVNKGNERRYFNIDTIKTYMADNLGNQSAEVGSGTNMKIKATVGSGAQDSTFWPGQQFEPDIPLNIWVSGKGLSEEATSVSIALAASNPSGQITLRNIPIQIK